MNSNPYKPTRSECSPQRKLQVWQMRLKTVLQSIEDADNDDALRQLEKLRADIVPSAYPEFADNLDWLYHSVSAHVADGREEDAKEILSALLRMLALAHEREVAV